MLKRFAAILMAVVASAAIAAPVAAAGPLMARWQVTIPNPADQGFVDCGGALTFNVELEGRFTATDYGDVLKIHGNVDGTATGSNGVVIRVHHAWTETYDWLSGTWTSTGLGFGQGVVGTRVRSLDRGRLVIDGLGDGEVVFEAGGHELALSGFNAVGLTCAMLEAAAG